MPCVRFHQRLHHGFRHHPFGHCGMMGRHHHHYAGFHHTPAGCWGHHHHDHHQGPFTTLAHKAIVDESEQAFMIRMDVPGAKAHQVTIEEKDGEIEIMAIRMNDGAAADQVANTYQDVLYVDPYKADLDKAQANLNEGVLMIHIPKKITAPNGIEIEAVDSHPPARTDTEFRIELDIPGVKPNQVNLKINQDVLMICGERTIGPDNTAVVTRRMLEIPRGTDMAQARAYLVDGVLTVVAPKVDEIPSAPLRHIPVNEMPSIEDLVIGNDGEEEEEEEKDEEKVEEKEGDQVMVETVEEKEWEHIDDRKPPAQD